MVATMTPCSTAILAAEVILQILHLKHRDFHRRSCMKVLRENGGFHPKWNLGALLKINIKICQFKENGLCICWLKSEHNYLEKSARKMHLLWMML